MSEQALRAARDAFEQGDRQAARTMLEDIVESDEGNVEAWWLLAQVVELDEEKQICLENVVALDPGHERAQTALQALRSGSGAVFFDDDPFAEAASDLDAAFRATDDDFDIDDEAFDVDASGEFDGELGGRLDRLASNRRLMIALIALFGVGSLCMFIVAFLLAARII
ncbi:MAG: hypothetical protein JXB47_10400 [Anaerolineae bacterium]|nr:hypothetical protein [Anaerolineae bacterium]